MGLFAYIGLRASYENITGDSFFIDKLENPNSEYPGEDIWSAPDLYAFVFGSLSLTFGAVKSAYTLLQKNWNKKQADNLELKILRSSQKTTS